MKIRNGFVSNSSSSSFTCSSCGETWEGYNGEYGDIQQLCCINGHSLCSECVESIKDTSQIYDLVLKNMEEEEQIGYRNSPLLLQEYIDEEYGNLLGCLSELDLEWDLPPEACPICLFEKLRDKDGFEYLLAVHSTNKEAVLKEMKERFSSYSDFASYKKAKE